MLKIKQSSIDKRTKKIAIATANRGKGKRGESGVGELYSNWYREPESFYRTAGSGGGRKIGAAGDLTCPKGFIFVVECKNSEAWEFKDFLIPYSKKGNLSIVWQWWEQVLIATEIYNDGKSVNQPMRYPQLIIKKNHHPYICMMPSVLEPEKSWKLNDKINVDIPPNHFLLNIPEIEGLGMIYNSKFLVCMFEDFLNVNPPPNLFISQSHETKI